MRRDILGPAGPVNPFTTVQPADRIPSHGTQLSADGTADLTRTGRPVPTFGAPARPERPATLNLWDTPVTLNLWDTSADSLPETWSR